jgi:hypothetical protein
MTTTATTTARQCDAWTAYKDRRRREGAHSLGLDPVTLKPLTRPTPFEAAALLAGRVEADADNLGHRDRVEVLAALAAFISAESANRSAAALAEIASSLARSDRVSRQ